MISINRKQNCCGCYACYNACPNKCIDMNRDDEGFVYPHVRVDNCINCGICESVCPFISDVSKKNINITYAARAQNNKVVIDSSSGGVFAIIANQVLKEQGVVVGAAFSEDYEAVYHICIGDANELQKLQKSKYIQSEINEIYSEVKCLLDKKMMVLFSGVPCQVLALKNFLRHDYDNLLCVEVVCHGTPSVVVWNKYLDYINKDSKRIKGIDFRNKKISWQDYGCLIDFDNKHLFTLKDENPYLQMFFKNLSLRPSCYECKVKKQDSVSDITLGDYWGIGNNIPEFNDSKGVSAVILRSEKGIRYFEKLKGCIIYYETDYEDVVKNNYPLIRSVDKPNDRDQFFSDVKVMDFESLAKKYTPYAKKTFAKQLYRRMYSKALKMYHKAKIHKL